VTAGRERTASVWAHAGEKAPAFFHSGPKLLKWGFVPDKI
jgi:hypothetical protein